MDKTTIKDKLAAGIRAAKAGKNHDAQLYFNQILYDHPEHIPALLWLAFVVPSPQGSIDLLEQVLRLDPDNERAKAGLRWAKQRITGPEQAVISEPETASPPDETAQAEESPADPTRPTDPVDGEALRRQLLESDASESAKKGVLAQRARRSFDSMLKVLVLAIGVVGLLAAGMSWWLFGSEETLAALLPLDTVIASTTEAAPDAVAGDISPQIVAEADTIAVEPDISSETPPSVPITELRGPIIEPNAASVLPLPGNIAALDVPAVDVDVTALVGPEAVEPEPVDNLLLPYQPQSEDEKWIEVNVSTQQVTAWEGTTPVFTFIASTGLPNTPTVLGQYNIYWKLESTLMTGPDYYLPNVPYTMYFYRGYALHGAYWHENFGEPMSHGCVNLDEGDAQRLFEWADPVIPEGATQVTATADNPGTLVVVHD